MNAALKWTLAVVAWIVVLSVFGIWRIMDNHAGGGALSGALRGIFVVAGLYLPYRWAKGSKPKEG